MENLKFYVSQFEEEFDQDILVRGERLRQEFVDKFPLEGIKNLSLDRYALGLDDKEESLSWWLEYKTVILGSIKGGTALKHKIYYSRKYDEWVYPEEFNTSIEAWEYLREELYNFLNGFNSPQTLDLTQYKLIPTMNVVRTKLLYMYYPDKVVPIYNLEHLKKSLTYFEYDKGKLNQLDLTQANLELKGIFDELDVFQDWNTLKFMNFIYKKIIKETRYYKIAPGENAKYWDDCFQNGYICIGWDEIGDLGKYADYNEFLHRFHEIVGNYGYKKSKATEKANELWAFYSLQPGDIVVCNNGTSKVVGIGEVNEEGYTYTDERDEFKHIVGVDWRKDFTEKEIPVQKYWAMKTVYEISEELYKMIREEKGDARTVQENYNFTDYDKKLFKQIEANLERKGNVILYGPPGTGKTYLTQQYLNWKKANHGGQIHYELISFHPSFAYEDFIEGYKPYSAEGQLRFSLEDGVFKGLCTKARDDENKDNKYYLIIDEINRGDVAKIFGEMITLIEKDKRGLSLKLSQSRDNFTVPDNVYIIATMNTSDKSIKMMDAALRRRFGFIECLPSYELINTPLDNLDIAPGDILSKINKSLREIEDRDKQIGHAYFMENGKQIDTIEELKEAYLYDIIPLVAEYCYNDYEKMAEIIGESFVDKDNEKLKEDLIQVDDFFINSIRDKFGDQHD